MLKMDQDNLNANNKDGWKFKRMTMDGLFFQKQPHVSGVPLNLDLIKRASAHNFTLDLRMLLSYNQPRFRHLFQNICQKREVYYKAIQIPPSVFLFQRYRDGVLIISFTVYLYRMLMEQKLMECLTSMLDVQILNCLASMHQAPIVQESPADLLLSLRHSSDLEGKTHFECVDYLSQLITDVRAGYGLICPRTDMLMKIEKINNLRDESAPEQILKNAVDTVHQCLQRYQLELTQLDVPVISNFPSPSHSTPIKRPHSPQYRLISI
ncbi:ORF3L [Planaria asexual strain-specific virus-like element type 1]|uniref:ORF3L n=1 Tax=Planaria asexual strain-specific virus-like element type 2 TaxID=159253 RepID=Q910R8_9VIRU|nr:ORF3L [Planaria asexual strain-specific virus-like element type 1]AAK53630.1 ORF3L [Planaria asexual strain-specific virus-like element type 1]AAK53635.1 ORF3L [Planaria asexual strain-specific virus-like element type 2]